MAQKKAAVRPERPRFQAEDAGRQGLWRPERAGRFDHRAPARHKFHPGTNVGIGRTHAVRAGRRAVEVRVVGPLNRHTVERLIREIARGSTGCEARVHRGFVV